MMGAPSGISLTPRLGFLAFALACAACSHANPTASNGEEELERQREIAEFQQLHLAEENSPEGIARQQQCDSLATLAWKDLQSGKCIYTIHGTVEASKELWRHDSAMLNDHGVVLHYACVFPTHNFCYTDVMNQELNQRYGKDFFR